MDNGIAVPHDTGQGLAAPSNVDNPITAIKPPWDLAAITPLASSFAAEVEPTVRSGHQTSLPLSSVRPTSALSRAATTARSEISATPSTAEDSQMHRSGHQTSLPLSSVRPTSALSRAATTARSEISATPPTAEDSQMHGTNHTKPVFSARVTPPEAPQVASPESAEVASPEAQEFATLDLSTPALSKTHLQSDVQDHPKSDRSDCDVCAAECFKEVFDNAKQLIAVLQAICGLLSSKSNWRGIEVSAEVHQKVSEVDIRMPSLKRLMGELHQMILWLLDPSLAPKPKEQVSSPKSSKSPRKQARLRTAVAVAATASRVSSATPTRKPRPDSALPTLRRSPAAADARPQSRPRSSRPLDPYHNLHHQPTEWVLSSTAQENGARELLDDWKKQQQQKHAPGAGVGSKTSPRDASSPTLSPRDAVGPSPRDAPGPQPGPTDVTWVNPSPTETPGPGHGGQDPVPNAKALPAMRQAEPLEREPKKEPEAEEATELQQENEKAPENGSQDDQGQRAAKGMGLGELPGEKEPERAAEPEAALGTEMEAIPDHVRSLQSRHLLELSEWLPQDVGIGPSREVSAPSREFSAIPRDLSDVSGTSGGLSPFTPLKGQAARQPSSPKSPGHPKSPTNAVVEDLKTRNTTLTSWSQQRRQDSLGHLELQFPLAFGQSGPTRNSPSRDLFRCADGHTRDSSVGHLEALPHPLAETAAAHAEDPQDRAWGPVSVPPRRMSVPRVLHTVSPTFCIPETVSPGASLRPDVSLRAQPPTAPIAVLSPTKRADAKAKRFILVQAGVTGVSSYQQPEKKYAVKVLASDRHPRSGGVTPTSGAARQGSAGFVRSRTPPSRDPRALPAQQHSHK